MEGRRGGEADGHPPLLATRRALRLGERGLYLAEDAARVDQQALARLGQLDAARLAAEELHLQLGLQRLDLLAERRLLHAKALGGAGHVPLLGYGDAVAQMAQVHGLSLWYGYCHYDILD